MISDEFSNVSQIVYVCNLMSEKTPHWYPLRLPTFTILQSRNKIIINEYISIMCDLSFYGSSLTIEKEHHRELVR